MAKKYTSPIILGPMDTPGGGSLDVVVGSTRDLKDDISTSFVYGDDNYEEEYVVPDVVEEIVPSDTGSEESAE